MDFMHDLFSPIAQDSWKWSNYLFWFRSCWLNGVGLNIRQPLHLGEHDVWNGDIEKEGSWFKRFQLQTWAPLHAILTLVGETLFSVSSPIPFCNCWKYAIIFTANKSFQPWNQGSHSELLLLGMGAGCFQGWLNLVMCFRIHSHCYCMEMVFWATSRNHFSFPWTHGGRSLACLGAMGLLPHLEYWVTPSSNFHFDFY